MSRVFHFPMQSPDLPNGPALAVTDSLDTTPAISFEDVRGAMVFLPAGCAISTLTFYAAPANGGTFVAAYDDTPTTPIAAQLTGLDESRCYPVPAKMYGAGAIKMVGDVAGTVYLSMKG